MGKNILFAIFLLIVSQLHSSCQKSDQVEYNDESSVDKELVLQLINVYRTSGCNCGSEGYFAPAAPVKWNNVLEKAAKEHCTDMYSNNFFSHIGSDGSRMSDRIKKLGYDWITCAENIGSGYKNEEQVIKGWINSPGHCSNIMNPNFKEIGVAMEGFYWTLVLGTH